MSDERAQYSKGKLKYFTPQAAANCAGCREIAKKVDSVERQQTSILEILGEHKVLLSRILSQNVSVEKIMSIFPISSEEKLTEFEKVLSTNTDPYKRQMQLVIAGNAERNLHLIFGQDIIMNFNVDGISGKKRLRDFCNVFSVIIDVISTFSKTPDKTLRAAFQRQKKKIFKQATRNKTKQISQTGNEKLKQEEEYNEVEFIEEGEEINYVLSEKEDYTYKV